MCRSGTHTHTYNKIKVWFLKLFALLIYIINIFPKGALNSSSSFHISSVSNLLKLGLKKSLQYEKLKVGHCCPQPPKLEALWLHQTVNKQPGFFGEKWVTAHKTTRRCCYLKASLKLKAFFSMCMFTVWLGHPPSRPKSSTLAYTI